MLTFCFYILIKFSYGRRLKEKARKQIKELLPLLHVGEKSFQRWIDRGLKVVPGSKRPILILGSDLKGFLKNKDAKKKVKLKRNEFYCLTCKAPRRAKRGSLKTLSDRKTGDCCVCSGKMSKIIKPYQKDYLIPSPSIQMSIIGGKHNYRYYDKNFVRKRATEARVF